MNKTWIIFRREYLNIVRKKSFLLSTFLVPLGFAAIFGIQIIAAKFVEKDTYTVYLQEDDTAVITSKLTDSEQITFEMSSDPLDSLKAKVKADKKLLLLTVAPTLLEKKVGTATIFGGENPSNLAVKEIERKIKKAVESYKQDLAGISDEQLAATEFELTVNTTKLTAKSEKSTNIKLATGIGFAVCFLMYMLMAIYGSILMQGVIEEKSNRIVEVIVSSVRPFQLLLGKTLSIASVGITQFLLWGILTFIVMLVLSPLAAGVDPNAMQSPGMDVQEANNMAAEILFEIQNFDWTVLWYFPIYFLGGFFLYGSLMAAAGSAVDNIQDAQQFTFPITIPLMLPILFVSNIVQNPNGTFALFASLFPFFSPMSMLVRISLVQVPWWQIALSLLLLIGTFLGGIWLAGRIYRTGILMYGKKPSFGEIFRWIRYRQ